MMAATDQDNGRLGIIVLITPNRFIQAMMQTVLRILPDFKEKYRMRTTLESARELIANERQQRAAVSQ